MVCCRRCSKQVAKDFAVPLWDGHVYCIACVESACPGLAEYARAHPTLGEGVPRKAASNLRHFCRYFFGPQLLLVPLFWLPCSVAACCYGPGILLLLAVFSAFAFVFMSFVALILLLDGYAVAERHYPRAISVGGGKVAVVTPERRELHSLAECRWVVKDLGWYCPDGDFLSNRRAVLLYVPRSEGLGWQVYGCGLTPPLRAQWEGFLRLAAVPRKVPFPWGRCLVGSLLGALAGCLLGTGLGRLLEAGLDVQGWALALGVLGFVDGAVLPGLYLGLGSLPSPKKLPAAWSVALGFAVVGLKVSGRRLAGADLWCGLFVAALNAGIGALVLWDLKRRLGAHRGPETGMDRPASAE